MVNAWVGPAMPQAYVSLPWEGPACASSSPAGVHTAGFPGPGTDTPTLRKAQHPQPSPRPTSPPRSQTPRHAAMLLLSAAPEATFPQLLSCGLRKLIAVVHRSGRFLR